MRAKFLYHSFFWLSYVFLNSFINYINNPNFNLSDQVSKFVISISYFYFVVFILFNKRKIIYKIILIIVGIFLFYLVRYIVYKYILTSIFDYPNIEKLDSSFFIGSIWWWLHYTVYAYFFWLYKKNIERISTINTLHNQKLKIQYDFLKAQINPHFLYNTLSFFYSKTAAIDMETAGGIALLTDIMRYSLQQGEADGKVELEDEVAHLNSYIRLQQMRFNNTLNIEFDNDIETEKYRILPHVFITLVENAFKHGEVNNPMHPLKISLKEENTKMIFSVKNKIQLNPVINPGTGVGLSNIRNRVKMEYGDAASLENNISDDFFSVSFSVPLALLEKQSDERPNNNDARPIAFINKKIAL